MRRAKTPLEAVMERIRVTDGGCWEWQLVKSWYGYGRWGYRGKNGYAHRMAYELLVGPIPEGRELDHKCKNRACVNPAHLEPVTHAENVRRGVHAQKTHCKSGHAFTDENAYVNARGHRICRECRRNYFRRLKPPPRDRTRCKRGHLLEGYNLRIRRSDGARICRSCVRDRAREAKRARGAIPWAQRRAMQTHCPHGHEYTLANTYKYTRDGRTYRYCRECNRQHVRRKQASP